MRLIARDGSPLHLTYCMNVHPGGTVASTRRALEDVVRPLRRRLDVDGPLALGLRLGAAALASPQAVSRAACDLYEGVHDQALEAVTGNAFVLGEFHGRQVKEAVYAPTWREEERRVYTLAFARLLALLRMAGGGSWTPSLSTAPGSWRAWGAGADVDRECAEVLARTAHDLHVLEATCGVPVRLGLEPEPGCTIQTVDEAIAFFAGPLATVLPPGAPGRDLLGVCYDVCHQAVVHEDPDRGLDRLLASGVPIVKVQASCALEVPDPADPAAREALARFDEEVYLHQVGVRDPRGVLHVARDLPEALAEEAWRAWAPWRVHFHVPVFRREVAGGLGTTAAFLDRVLARVAAGGITEHVEIETYTWDVLPEAERRAGSGFDLVEALAREYEHVLGVLEAHGARRPSPGAESA